ncbi:MAG: hypothetical protein COW00_11280 [Bdellovibrio sp. CG12_big_fil_rev_8_21_14_0_65_39_13]|nr:MAG: hypothetical protein COW78_16635 [Bdellovibrio sp. CG22_combo_CG10-13_8_21_14_all_39_27]PIQ59303.1 MAG: hypothetical protein COW00_11280 [Bdellovibrio sp. CG12_big_fil_rev_8_21_14_0_65_39_13]PIR32314.1 MAG: hypothetical protein COV37_20570 [Bdellovibrio sp. CG11_big_fil_rev_8_21_14_0_20_39_38]PJB52554.1 MAG: hypothetical protein CO099_12085 [Bdellovibrio sp. CG_4_9_14_3_um_filter_39_7]
MITHYKHHIISLFKSKFRDALHQGLKIEYTQLIHECTIEVGMPIDEIHTELESWFENIYHQSWLTPFLNTTEYEEIIVHSENLLQIFGSRERKFHTIAALEAEDYQLSLEIMAFKYQQKWHLNEPFVSFQISYNKNNYRATLVHQSLSSNHRSKLSLRKHQHQKIELQSFCHDERDFEIVQDLIVHKRNVLIAGNTGCGKTSLLNSMLRQIDPNEHVIVLEDTSEIDSLSEQWTYWLAQQKLGFHLKDYCSYALRLRPDRIVIGELRSQEIIPFLLSMNTGHKGLMSTIHANSALESYARLKTLFALYSEQSNIQDQLLSELIVKGLDAIIFMKNKKIAEIIQIYGQDDGQLIFEKIVDANQ